MGRKPRSQLCILKKLVHLSTNYAHQTIAPTALNPCLITQKELESEAV